MKSIISVSLGPSSDDYEFEAKFLGHEFRIKRIGTDGDLDKATDTLLQWDHEADALCLGGANFQYIIGSARMLEKNAKLVNMIRSRVESPLTMGDALRRVSYEWALRHIQFKFGNNYFNNSRVLFLSGVDNYVVAKVMSEFTRNLSFADPIYKNDIPKFLGSLKDLELYAKDIHEVLQWVPGKRLVTSAVPIQIWNRHIVRKAMQKANIIVVPYHNFYDYLQKCTLEELGGKIIITATAYDDRIEFLKERGVDVIIDCAPKILKEVVGFNVLEGMIGAALGKPLDRLTDDDLLEVISEERMDPRVIYPSGLPKRVNRFAFVIHPLSQEQLRKDPAIDMISKVAPPVFMDTVEKVIAYAPPWVYSKVTGIKSPTGVEAEGWLISVGGTPKQMLSHDPDFTYRRLLQAAQMAKRLGAQIMGLGAFTKVVGDAGVTVAKKADIPITTGNSYSASGALWAAADAVRRMGLIKVEKGKKINGKTMVIGATGSIGSVCCRLLAKAFNEVYMVDTRNAKLLALKESIEEETPDVKIKISTRSDRYVKDMDVIVTSASSTSKNKILDIMDVKPGCVITDIARPLDLSREDVAKRPDVLVIESGEILLPGQNVEMKDIGLPPRVAFACMAETIVLALEGRFEVFTIGRDIEWEKVREIYRLGLKHGMKLAAISGINGVITDEDILRVKELALAARKEQPEKEAVTA